MYNNLTDYAYNATESISTIPWNQDMILSLLILIAVCEVTRTVILLFTLIDKMGRKGK